MAKLANDGQYVLGYKEHNMGLDDNLPEWAYHAVQKNGFLMIRSVLLGTTQQPFFLSSSSAANRLERQNNSTDFGHSTPFPVNNKPKTFGELSLKSKRKAIMITPPSVSINLVYRPSSARVVGRAKNQGKPVLRFGEGNPRTFSSEFGKFCKMNWSQKLTVLLLGPPILLTTLFLRYVVCPHAEEGYTLAHERGEKSSFDKALARSREGRPPLPEKALEMDSIIRTLKFMFWGQFGSDALVKATVHLDPDYKPYKPNWQMHKAHKNDEEELCDLNEDLQKYEIPDPPPKLGLLDRFFLKYYFKTKPSWECTEPERQAISAKYRDID